LWLKETLWDLRWVCVIRMPAATLYNSDIGVIREKDTFDRRLEGVFAKERNRPEWPGLRA
jgi:hypothetical protein